MQTNPADETAAADRHAHQAAAWCFAAEAAARHAGRWALAEMDPGTRAIGAEANAEVAREAAALATTHASAARVCARLAHQPHAQPGDPQAAASAADNAAEDAQVARRVAAQATNLAATIRRSADAEPQD